MRTLIGILVLGLVLVLLAAVVVLVAALAFTGVGSVLSRFIGLGLFESTVIATLSGFLVAYVVSKIWSSVPYPSGVLGEEDEDWEEEEEWEEEEPEPPIVPWRRGKLESTPPPKEPSTPTPSPSRKRRR
jgi:hypothetical protein